jgi:hypothetical protein
MENNQINYFVWINRILTNLLSGIIGTVVSVTTYYGFIYLFQIQVIELNSVSFLLFIILILALLLGCLTYQILQNYFCHILEKDKYTEMGKKSLYNLTGNIILAVVFTILGFILLTRSESATFWSLIGFTATSFIYGHLIREKHDLSLNFSNIVGTSIGVAISCLMIMVAFGQNLGLAIVVGLLSLPIIAITNSSLEFLSITLKSFVGSTEDSSEELKITKG